MKSKEKVIQLLIQRFGDVNYFSKEDLEEMTAEQINEFAAGDSRDLYR